MSEVATSFDRPRFFRHWWWSLDHWLLGCVFAIILIGIYLNFAASPAVAATIHASTFHFIKRQMVFLPLAVALMLGISMLSPRNGRRVAIITFIGTIVLMMFTLLFGIEIKGASRWINILGFSLQPSEFIKPSFAVVAAWMFALEKKQVSFKGDIAACGLYVLVAGLLLAQPDVGMTIVVTMGWASQFFIAGLPIIWVISLILSGMVGLVSVYFVFDHVHTRVNNFFDPNFDSYQVKKSIEAFQHGGLFGTGPGEGVVKLKLPDAHTDFILAVAGEEFGAIICLVIIMLFCFVVIKGYANAMKKDNMFIMFALAGLVTQFAVQTSINICSTLNLIPTKGMTLPFISYGGSSLLSLAMGMGFILCLSRGKSSLRRKNNA